ncbi:aldehyde dehydrogenase family protein [Celeribacter sp.]|uniref:aldehyde dehydrogenase family protein n=1 Tax=Celeribacter sp. TaxID=1890673 RepID=UPI003A94CC89
MTILSNDFSLLGEGAKAALGRTYGLHIDGKEVQTAKSYPLTDPSTGKEFARASEAGEAELNMAVAAAKLALTGEWKRLRPHERELRILRLADILESHVREISEIETLCSGRLLANTSGVDVMYSAHVLRYMGGWATKLEGQTMRLSVPYIPNGELSGFTFREPIGVVGAIVPWNVALGIAVWKIAPALAAGCSVVLKPAPQTPISAIRFAELAIEAGIPAGVINIVTGSRPEVGQMLVAHKDVALVTFTGSTEVGRKIAVSAASQFKKCSLELGGKSPVIMMGDADVEAAAQAAAVAVFSNHGQNCCAGSRLYVHRSIYDQVTERVVELANDIQLSAPLIPGATMGPVIGPTQQARIMSIVDAGVYEGATLAAGGVAVDHVGSYVRPTVLLDVTSDMTPVKEEIFGPVLVATPFDTDEEVLALANDSQYGLGASVFTNDAGRIHRMTQGLEAGSVWINVHNALDVALPFGGWKDSGIGNDLGESSVLAYTKLKASVHYHA